ncbi:MAG: hypothetical protein KDD70_19000, partial [Bdellovibrionales bacterium]|nr:hypothetical protein [Bdellovibrionales bacterium]
IVDDAQKYIERFYQFVKKSGARYAVPFASNQCYLHRETFHFNTDGRTPTMVADYWKAHKIEQPQLKVMVSGDAWSEEDGFQYTGIDWFTNREQILKDYQQEKARTLETFYEKEARAKVSIRHMRRFFDSYFKAVPFFVRNKFKGHPILYVLSAGENRFVYEVDIFKRQVTELPESVVNDQDYPLQIHLSAYVMRHALGVDLMAHLGIGKRIRYRVTKAEKDFAELHKTLLDFHEYELLPLRNCLRPRFIINWISRWRELVLYAELLVEKLVTGKLNISRHLVAPLDPLPADSAEHEGLAHEKAA